MSGPYETNGDALRDAAHVYDASRRQERRGTMGQVNEGLLLAALTEAGVELGAYDRGIAGWLATFEPEAVQAVIGWVERAHAAAPRPPARALPTAAALLALAADVMGLEAARDNAEQRVREMIGEFDAIAALAHRLQGLNPGGDCRTASVADAIVRIAEQGDVPGDAVSALVDGVSYPVRLALLAERDRAEPGAADAQRGDLGGLIERLFHRADADLDDEYADRQYTLEAVRDGLADALGLLGIQAGPTLAAVGEQHDHDFPADADGFPADCTCGVTWPDYCNDGAEQYGTVTHYTTSPRAAAECGAHWSDGTVSPYADDVTCPACLELRAAGGAR